MNGSDVHGTSDIPALICFAQASLKSRWASRFADTCPVLLVKEKRDSVKP